MAAGIITELVTTRSGATVPLQFFVDDTVAPTKYWHVQTVVDQAGAEIFGEVTASPAANTLGDRLKTLNSSLTAGTQKTQVVQSDGSTNVTFNNNGQAVKASSQPVVPATDWVYNTGKYVAVAASQTDAIIQASTGAAGDYLDHVIVVPATTAPGVVTIKDNATALISYPGGGTTALLTLTPFTIYVGAVSSSGAWKITTGANVSILAVGRFS